MKIGIDASCILPRKTGIGFFTRHLLKELFKLETDLEFTVFLNSLRHDIPEGLFEDHPHVKVKNFSIPGPMLVKSWRYLRFPPIEFFTGFVDAFHSMTGYLPPQIKGRRIATVYDLFFLRDPDKCHELGGKFFAETFPKRLPKYDRIICPSNSTKSDLIKLLGIPEEKITVIYGGVDFTRFRQIKDESLLERIRQEYCLPPHYILSVCTHEPRKNLEGLLIAYRHLKEILFNPPKLVLVGDEGWQQEKLKETVLQHKLRRDVIFTGYVPEDHLSLIYNSALIFVYPSFWEGFGLPVLEAMACGIPSIISSTPALKEIAGDAVFTVDPYNYYEMAEKMKDLITSHRLRSEYSHEGLQHVKKFSWRLTAKKTLRVYEEITGPASE